MQQPAMLVTSDGKRVLPETDEFFTTLSQFVPGSDPIGFAVRSLGFVRFHQLDGCVAIELHPRSVDRRALLAAERRIGELRAKLFLIRYLDTAGRSQTAVSAEMAIARLRELRTPLVGALGPTERFRVELQDYGNLLRDRDNPLRLMSQKWCESFAEFDSTVLSFASESGLLPQLAIVGVARREAGPRFRFLGDALFPWLDSGYQQRVIGEELENFPDKQHGAWMSDFYKSVALRGEPRFDRVTAQVGVGRGQNLAFWTRFERLQLPWRTASGETVVSTVVRKLALGADTPGPLAAAS